MADGNDYDVAIIGAGIAGLNAGITTVRHGLRTVIIDRLGAGGQVINVDRIDNLPGPAEGQAGFELGPLLQMQADEAGAQFALDTITSVSSTGSGFKVTGGELDLTCGTLIIAAGSSRRILGIPGEAEFEGRGVSHCASCDGPLMRGRDVCVIGGGDSALDEALALAAHAAKVTIIHRGHRLRAGAWLQKRCSEAANIELLPGTVVEAIRGTDGVTLLELRTAATGAVSERPCHGVFVNIGLSPNTAFLEGMLRLDGDGRIDVDLGMRTSVPGIFAAGDIRTGSVAHLAASAGDGVTAAMSSVQYLAAGGATEMREAS